MVVNDGLIVHYTIQHISVLNQDILQFVSHLLKLIDPFIQVQDVIEQRGRRSGLGRGDTRFDMLIELLRNTRALLEPYPLQISSH